MDLPKALAQAVEPLFTALPMDRAMTQLVVGQGATPQLVEQVEQINQAAALTGHPDLQSALWLYIDELDRSHTLSQGIKDATGSFWHGIMHRREGDFSNSHYWFRNTGDHPAMGLIQGYDGHRFIDEVEARHTGQADDLVDMQRREWQTLFTWCAQKG